MESRKLIIFDLDGVLIDFKDVHYESLNKALLQCAGESYVISREEHLSKYDGLNTKAKLELLTKEKGLDASLHQKIFDKKQDHTEWGLRSLKPDFNISQTLSTLKNAGYTLVVASNSIRNTVKLALHYTEYIKYIDFYLSNEDVRHPKPSSEIYLACMIKAGVSPKETLIVEDSYNGRIGAEKTGASVMGVNSPKDITYENISKYLNQDTKKTKWSDPQLNILIPMAGRGSRFEQAGYMFPKPLIEVHGKPMIQVVVENLNIEANYIFLVQKEHYEKYNLKTMLNLIAPKCKIVIVNEVTQGAACTTLLAEEFINNDNPLLIANSDQFLEWDAGSFMYSMAGDHVDGGIVTFKATHPKWSFAKIENGRVTEVAEKNPISDNATVGVYYWKHGKDYVEYASQMIQAGIKTNGEYYVCPVFNEAIKDHKFIKAYEIEKMWGLGDPSSFEIFISKYQGSL